MQCMRLEVAGANFLILQAHSLHTPETEDIAKQMNNRVRNMTKRVQKELTMSEPRMQKAYEIVCDAREYFEEKKMVIESVIVAHKADHDESLL